jgi:hypothetical protein
VSPDTPSSASPTATSIAEGAQPGTERRVRPGSALLVDRWHAHLPTASIVLLPLLQEAASTGAEFPHAERALFMACDFWTAVATRTLVAYLGAEPVGKLRYMGIMYSAMGASDISDTLLRAANALTRSAALKDRQAHLVALEARLLRAPDSVDRLIAGLVRAIIANSDTYSHELPALGADDPIALKPSVATIASQQLPTPRREMEKPDPQPQTLHDQLPLRMDYDLRRRLETFANGDCSSEAFIQELSAQCSATPDFIWEVLALIDQYHRRGKISAEFQRSIRELIERPALTHEPPPAFAAEPTAPEEPVPSAANTTASANTDLPASPAPPPATEESDSERAGDHSNHAAYPPTWAANPEIIVPTLFEMLRPTAESPPIDPGHLMSRPALAAADSRRDGYRLKPDVRYEEPEEFEVATGAVKSHRIRQVRLLQIALLAALFSCVTASSALSTLATAARPAVAATPPAPLMQIPSISLSSDRYIVYPGSTSAVIEVNRTGDPSADISFIWWTRSSGAKSGRDYRGSRPRTEHLPAGVNTLQWSIPILPNASRRHTELFYVAIGSPEGSAGVGTATRATVFVMGPN